MSLQGTFDVVTLTDLLRMLSAGSKTGELLIEAGGFAGRLELEVGTLCNAESTDARGTANTLDELRRRCIDVCFAIARQATGSFRFIGSETAGTPSALQLPIEPLLEALEQLTSEWSSICAVVPSTDLRPRLAAALPTADIVISADDWAMLARLDGHASISELRDPARESLVDVCRSLADLVRRGAVVLHESPTLAAQPDDDDHVDDFGDAGFSSGSAPEYGTNQDERDQREERDLAHHAAPGYFGPKINPVAPYGPGVDAPEASPVAVAVAVAGRAAGPITEPDSGGVDHDGPGPASTAPNGVGPTGDQDAVHHRDADHHDADPRDRGAILRLFSGLREA